MAHRLLFLLGGSEAIPALADAFVQAVGGRHARVAVLVQSLSGWEKHKTIITDPWIQRGITHFQPITPGEDGNLDSAAAAEVLLNATGIFICGGHTPTYHRLFATDPLRSLLRQQYQMGIPVAGVSAGALISMQNCQLSPDDTGSEQLVIVDGLGLIKDVVIGVHFTERNALPEVLETMSLTRIRQGLGIDEPACAVYEDEHFTRVLGKAVHQVEMLDFESMSYKITRL